LVKTAKCVCRLPSPFDWLIVFCYIVHYLSYCLFFTILEKETGNEKNKIGAKVVFVYAWPSWLRNDTMAPARTASAELNQCPAN